MTPGHFGPRTRCFWRTLSLLLCFGFATALATVAKAAPEAHLLRIDPRASRDSGDPVITTVIEVVQSKRISEATSDCATLRGDAQLGCMASALDKPNALYKEFPFPEKNAIFTVEVDGADRPATFLSHAEWGKSQREPGVGTAWLILIDADSRMGKSFDDAKQVAEQFVSSMGPHDIVNLMYFNDRQVVKDSKWLAASKKKNAKSFIDSVSGTYPRGGRNRSLLTIIKTAATDGFKSLGNVGQDVEVPMHQAMVVLSSGYGGADPSTTGPGAAQLSQYMTQGRFPPENTALPKAPVPVISVYFPYRTYDEFKMNSLEFMQNMANPQIGGFFTVVQQGEGSRAKKIVTAVRTRFSKMHIVRWKVSCIAPSVTQSFKLVFDNVQPPIAPDSTFKDVPLGIDPTSWPLDVNVKETQSRNPDGIYPGGHFKVFGDFCWGGDKSRAEVYFLPAGEQIPQEINSKDIAKAKKAQQQLIGMGMRGKSIETADTFVEFEAPDKDKIIHGAGSRAVARIVIYDNKAARTSGVTADTILELKATTAPLPLLWILGGAFALTMVALMVVVVVRSGKKDKRQRSSSTSSPGPPPAAGYPAPAATAIPGATRATLQGAAGVFTVVAGVEVRAGRDPSQCAILLGDGQVSTLHATLKFENGQLLVRDDNSNNGTFVNNARLPAGAFTPVPPGALLKFGPVEFAIRID